MGVESFSIGPSSEYLHLGSLGVEGGIMKLLILKFRGVTGPFESLRLSPQKMHVHTKIYKHLRKFMHPIKLCYHLT